MRTTMLVAAVLWVGLAQAAVPQAPALALSQAPAPTTPAPAPAAADDEDDDEGPAKPPPPVEAPKAEETQGAVTPVAPTRPGEEQRLVSGAPLYNPNVAVHIVEQKAYSDSGKRELVLFPVALQANGKFTQHFGTFGSFVWHLQENFGLQITGGYNWYNAESGFNAELVEKVRAEAQAATSLLWTWGVMGGVEVTPLYAKFAWFEGTLAHFSIVLNGGAGLGGTRHQLKPESVKADGSVSPATFGDTGARFMGSLGAGFRLQLGKHFAFRLEVRDVVYTAKVDSVNGCNVDDLRAMDAKLRMGQPVESAVVGGGCNVTSFTGTVEGTDYKRSNDVPLALNLVRLPSSDVLNNVGLYIGASFLF
ncbi:MAG: outer membrane beta-barrel domain-containing protein [Myxococcota bacterium]